MPRARTAGTGTRSHKKAAPADPALEAMVDTIVDDGANPDEKPAPRPRTQKPGPKKVISETTKLVGDALAVGISMMGDNPDKRKALTMPEAQSIGHPIVRMLSRRLPSWIKPFLPKTKLSPEDAADLEEIAATLAKWGMRLATVLVADFVEGKEKAQAGRQQAHAGEEAHAPVERPAAPGVSLNDLRAGEREQAVAQAAPAVNGHNPAFDILHSVDLGIEAA